MKIRFRQMLYGMGLLLLPVSGSSRQSVPVRHALNLDSHWHTVENDSDSHAYPGFEKPGYDDRGWKTVDVPHNWDDYGGYRRLLNGNRYGYAWYRKTFKVPDYGSGKRYFLWFEGVGAYATVWLNGKRVGSHAGGRTSFTLDVTAAIHPGGKNLLCVTADEPTRIRDLPWVSGGDSPEPGFSEGSQPLGIFRPVHLRVTGEVRVIPFGVHIWNDTTVSSRSATLYLETRVKNDFTDRAPGRITVVTQLEDRSGKVVATVRSERSIPSDSIVAFPQQLAEVPHPRLWSLKDPYLYQVVTEVYEKGVLMDRTRTAYGIRWISWPLHRSGSNKCFLLNGKPVYINGVAGYEHLLGGSHAFSAAQVRTRVRQVEAAGFNAFRDAHQPHNLRYGEHFEHDGILWWPQFAAHIWFDNAAFKKNFKKLLRDWIIERRNNPAVILWGLENESTLPTDFARQCSEIIRQLDPTATSQRPITTCNGGTGTDWNVPQNWSGTYGGDPYQYAAEVQQEKLVGEYGAWRSIDLHTEGPFRQNGPLSEDRMAQLMELKVRQADSVKDKFCGQFMWLLHSHDNPGRVQSGEGYRALDQVGPVNYKGLFTIWGEPVDAFYMYRANDVSAEKHPMVYIVSHTWPDRWTKPGMKHGITVYSNCAEVELFNDVGACSLGKRKRAGIGTHFEWDSADIRYNVLYAVGYMHGKPVAKDCIVLNHLPRAPHFDRLIDTSDVIKPVPGYHYLYRVDCGGPDYRDSNGNLWMGDRHLSGNDTCSTWGSLSWADHYPGIPPFFASQRRTFDPIGGTRDWKLFQTFRYGRQDLKYVFPVPNGDYRIVLYFIEPWYGVGGGMNCTGWRLFDVAVNGKTMLHDLDIWKAVGTDHVLKKTLSAHVTNGKLVISFPKVNSVQAVISAISIATKDGHIHPAPPSPQVIGDLLSDPKDTGKWHILSWLDTGQPQYADSKTTFSKLPPDLYGATWIQGPGSAHTRNAKVRLRFKVNAPADIYVGIDSTRKVKPSWLSEYASTGTYVENDQGGRFLVYHKRFQKGATVHIEMRGEALFIAARYASDMTPAYDLKPVKHYGIDQAVIKGKGLVRGTVNRKVAVTFSRSSGDILVWRIHVGIAGRYNLRIRYGNSSRDTLGASLRLVSGDGRMMEKAALQFIPTGNKWRNSDLMMATSINAGDYKLFLYSRSAKGLHVSGLDVQ